MKHLKNFSAYLLTWFVILVGVLSLVSFFTFHEAYPGSPFGFISIIGIVLVFYPSYEYWLGVCKRLLDIKNKD